MKIEKLIYFKIISKGPISQHLKKSVVVDILANIIQVVMLAASTNALLGIDNSDPFGHVTIRVNCSKKQWLELIGKKIK